MPGPGGSGRAQAGQVSGGRLPAAGLSVCVTNSKVNAFGHFQGDSYVIRIRPFRTSCAAPHPTPRHETSPPQPPHLSPNFGTQGPRIPAPSLGASPAPCDGRVQGVRSPHSPEIPHCAPAGQSTQLRTYPQRLEPTPSQPRAPGEPGDQHSEPGRPLDPRRSRARPTREAWVPPVPSGQRLHLGTHDLSPTPAPTSRCNCQAGTRSPGRPSLPASPAAGGGARAGSSGNL